MPALGAAHVAVDGAGLARPLAGVGTYTVEMVRALATTRPASRLTVWLPPGSAPAFEAEHVAWRRVPAMRLAGRHLGWPSRLRRSRPDALLGAAGQLPLTDPGCPQVVVCHDLAIYRNPSWFPGGQFLSTRVVGPRSFRVANAVVCVSEHTAHDVADIFGVPRARLFVAPLGVHPRFRPAGAEAISALRRRLQLPDRFVLFVGTIEPRKNLDTLLDAWEQLPDRVPLVIAGDVGWRAEATAARIAALGGAGVLHLGPVATGDLPALYSAATVLAHPAWYEGFGLTALEAMACGTPVVASNAASLPEVVGEAALLVDPGDGAALAEALGRVLGSAGVAADLRRRGVLRAAGFTWEHTAELTWRVLEQLS